jgi:phosphonate transport system substrate-binding protein
MTEPNTSPSHRAVSPARVLMIVVPIAILAIGAYFWSRTLEARARGNDASKTFAKILGTGAELSTSEMTYPDKNGDLLADSPDDPKECIKPDVLVFSYIAGETESVPEKSWKELLAALKQKTGHEVKFAHYDSADEQLDALKDGKLHIAGLNTGVVPAAVKKAGFIPYCTFGHDDGTYGITMQVLVPASSPIKKLADVQGHKIMFTRVDSNSGCKALLMLLKDQGLQPNSDYDWGFSNSHEESIKGVAGKRYEVAPVASDLLQRAAQNGDITLDSVRTIYESDRFPPACIGYVYNLTPELRKAIQETLKDFNLKGTGLEGKMGMNATKLITVDYKKDWESVRKINDLAAAAQKKRPAK